MSDPHVRQKAIEAAKAKTAAGCPIFEGRAWLTPRSAISKREAPCAVFAQGDESVEYVGGDRRNVIRTFRLDVVVACVITRESIDSEVLATLNAMAAEVESVMVPAEVDGVGLGVGESDIRYAGTSRPTVSALGDDIAEMTVSFDVVITTIEGEPTNAIYSQ